MLTSALVAVALLAVMGCGGGQEGGAESGFERGAEGGSDARPARPDSTERVGGRPAPKRTAVRRAKCPAGLAGCRAASGRIIFVERVDPDGDGDAHFVLASKDGVTAPGITVIDVRRDLRPRPLPGPGDRLSAAGPVRSGSYGQHQIEAVEVFAARR